MIPQRVTLTEIGRLSRSFPVTRMSVFVETGNYEANEMLLMSPYDPERLRSYLKRITPRRNLADDVFETALGYSWLERRFILKLHLVLKLRREDIMIVLRLRSRAGGRSA